MTTSIQYGLPHARTAQMGTFTTADNYIVDKDGFLVRVEDGEKQPNQPCPFCGSRQNHIETKPLQDNIKTVRVVCSRCRSQASLTTWYPEHDYADVEKQAYAKWNRRQAARQEEV